jgi:hypothetical protein
VVVICPPPFGEHQLGPSFEEVCTALDCRLCELEDVTAYSPLDDEHHDEAGHIAVAAAVEERVREMLE